MKTKWLLAPMLAVCGIGMLNFAIARPSPQTDYDGRLPVGEYSIATAQLYGEDWVDLKDGTVSFDSRGAAQQKGATRQLAANYRLQGGEAGFTSFTVETIEDAFENGGGGPRHGILRELETGEIEVLENTSANQPAPRDFSDATKADASFFVLAPNRL